MTYEQLLFAAVRIDDGQQPVIDIVRRAIGLCMSCENAAADYQC